MPKERAMYRLALISGIVLVAIAAILLFQRARRLRAGRELVGVLDDYFKSGSSVESLGQRARELAGGGYLHSSDFFALAVTAYQHAVAELSTRPHSPEDERRLMGLLARIKIKFGLADLYQVEGWRAGRE
jgi:hypothetical protein